MQDTFNTPLILADYIFNEDPTKLLGNELISDLYVRLLRRGKPVSNKDITMCLIHSIESEKDPLLYDELLKALELIVYRTPDDCEC